ncbi:hypothetical protein V5O48_010690 [Marasmius crinis-equi]|uniref:Glucose-methanol-choline oxidoreductase N-terminal domain-containing protein n=1 Tax=Marasmius crinis-equi TaxID=585013 RepID=A0ABR3F7P3_9AGAR
MFRIFLRRKQHASLGALACTLGIATFTLVNTFVPASGVKKVANIVAGLLTIGGGLYAFFSFGRSSAETELELEAAELAATGTIQAHAPIADQNRGPSIDSSIEPASECCNRCRSSIGTGEDVGSSDEWVRKMRRPSPPLHDSGLTIEATTPQATHSLMMTSALVWKEGGTTACVTAGRLAAFDSSLRILFLPLDQMSPPATRSSKLVDTPWIYRNTFSRHECGVTSSIDQTFFGTIAGRGLKPSVERRLCPLGNAWVEGQASTVSRLSVLSIPKIVISGVVMEVMLYARPPTSDFDDWEKQGNPGWGSKELIPLSQKAETYQVEDDTKVEAGYHGTTGPIKVSRSGPKITFTLGNQLLKVVAAYDPERGTTDDVDGFGPCNQYGAFHRYVDAQTGRSDTAHNYIYNQAENKNLKIIVKHRICRVIIENGRAVGVEYLPEAEENRASSEPLKAFASRLVVVSGGSFGSPAILQRSGIGSKKLLQRCEIQQIVDLPGVGENYKDHNLVLPAYLGMEDVIPMNEVFFEGKPMIEVHREEWTYRGTGLLATNGMNAGIKIRPNEKDLTILGDSFKPTWKERFEKSPDKPVLWIGTVAGYASAAPDEQAEQCFQMEYFTDYPLATGHVYIASSDPFAPLDFNPRFLEHEADVAVLRWGYKRTRELARRMKSYRGEYIHLHPRFPEGSAAVAGPKDGPVPLDGKDRDIAYTEDDDRAIDQFHREVVASCWHGLGTCAMKPREQGGVVDSRLNVYGVEHLKVADLSIAPLNVGANTYNTALVIGEKAAVIIAEELDMRM